MPSADDYLDDRIAQVEAARAEVASPAESDGKAADEWASREAAYWPTGRYWPTSGGDPW